MATKKKTKSAPKQYVTDSSIPIKQFYQKSTKKKPKEEPGKFPFTRGIHQGMYRCLLYTSPSPRDGLLSRMPSSA